MTIRTTRPNIGIRLRPAAIAVLVAWFILIAAPSLGAASAPDPARLQVPGATLTVHFNAGGKPFRRKEILDWVEKSAQAVSLYFGRFPIPEPNLLLVFTEGRGVEGGKAFGGPNAYIRVTVGRESTAADLAKDWVMVHEMIHLAVPLMDRRHDWLTEGIAVYVESVARLQAGHLDEATVWYGFVEGMEHGVPQSGDRGLDFTPTWGRTYWGGALFCLFADLEIRKRTGGKKTLRDALRGVLAAGGDFRKHWPIRKIFETGDKSTGTTALTELYDGWRAKAVDPKLPALWKNLGVTPTGGTVTFDDEAGLAGVRQQIGRLRAN